MIDNIRVCGVRQASDAGRYVCLAKNAAGRTSKEFLLRVQGLFIKGLSTCKTKTCMQLPNTA